MAWVLIEAGHDEDEHDIDVGILKVLDNEEDAKKALKEQVSDWKQRWGCDDDDIKVPDDDDECDDGCDDDCDDEDNISWNDDETEVTITSNDYCSDWCKVYKIEEI